MTETNAVDGEIIETGALQIQTAPGLTPAERINQVTQALAAIEEFQVRSRRLALKNTRPNDWRTWNGRLRPEVSGTDSIARTFGVKVTDVITEKKPTNNGYQIQATGTFTLPMTGYSVEGVMGSCRSDDDIVATRYEYEAGERKKIDIPAGDVDEATVIKKALANMRVNGILTLFGLRNVTAEELKEAGIVVGEGAKTTFSSKAWEISQGQIDLIKRFHGTEAEIAALKSNGDVTTLVNKLKAEKRKAPAPAAAAPPPEAASAPSGQSQDDIVDNLRELAEHMGLIPQQRDSAIVEARGKGLGALIALQADWSAKVKANKGRGA